MVLGTREQLAQVGADGRTAMDGVRSGYAHWSCPFCGAIATQETKGRVICDSRTCSCGAVALAAPTVDTDEIVDDALEIFGVQIRTQSRGVDALILEDLRHAGVLIREGQRARVREGSWGEYTSLWFRRPAGL
jgi:hypothetical protein